LIPKYRTCFSDYQNVALPPLFFLDGFTPNLKILFQLGEVDIAAAQPMKKKQNRGFWQILAANYMPQF
jgi:hypothetical protein